MILFAGDPHGSFLHLYPFIKCGEKISLIILGDLQLKSPQELEDLAQFCDLWFIHGNHDSKTISAFESIWGSQWQQRNLHGKVVQIEDKRIAGIGGVFRGQIWLPPNKPLFSILFIIVNIVRLKNFGEVEFHFVIVHPFFRQTLKR